MSSYYVQGSCCASLLTLGHVASSLPPESSHHPHLLSLGCLPSRDTPGAVWSSVCCILHPLRKRH